MGVVHFLSRAQECLRSGRIVILDQKHVIIIIDDVRQIGID